MHTVRILGRLLIVAGVALLASCRTGPPRYLDTALTVDQRIDDLLGRLTLEEKVGMVSGETWMETRAVARLGVPALKTNDGPLGVRYWSLDSRTKPANFGTTAFPAGVAMAATWDQELVEREGKAIAEQARALGRNMLLGPTVNIARLPQWGRNFEGYGEDPFLAARMAVAYINGVQSEGVIATVKHFAANNQEFERNRVDVRVSERALHEIYFPAFRASIQEANVGSVMSLYNKVNGLWAAENPYLLTDVLRKQFGFKGLVVSDWASTHTTVETANAGLDVEMPSAESLKGLLNEPVFVKAGFMGGFMAPEKLLPAVASGQVAQSKIDEKVRRILWAMFTLGIFDRKEEPTNVVDTPEQQAVAREAAVESMVLLKNAGAVLPLSADRLRSIAVIGPNAAVAPTGGGGSSLVEPKIVPVPPLEALKARVGSRVQVQYALGCAMEGEDKEKDTPAARAALIKEAVALARKSDAAVIFAGYSPATEQEMTDRTLALPAGPGRSDPGSGQSKQADGGGPLCRRAGPDGSLAAAGSCRDRGLVSRPGGRPGAGRCPLRRCQPVRQAAGHVHQGLEGLRSLSELPRREPHRQLRRGDLRGVPPRRQARHRAAVPVRARPVVHNVRVQRPEDLPGGGR